MFDNAEFGTKLKNHRKRLGMTQEEIAVKIGVSPQAVSKWENGECLPDCYNLKQLGMTYGISLDILLDMEQALDTDAVSIKIEQLATEYAWKSSEDSSNTCESIGDVLWEFWKSIFYVEIGNKELQRSEKTRGNVRLSRPNGMKIWFDKGIACTIKQEFADSFTDIKPEYLEEMKWLLSPEVVDVVSLVKCQYPTPKAQIIESTSLTEATVNDILLKLLETGYVEFIRTDTMGSGYKLTARKGIIVWLLLSAASLSGIGNYSVNEYIRTT